MMKNGSQTRGGYPTLTTIDVHTDAMGREAVAVLEERLDGRRRLSKKVEYQVELIKRGSVKVRK